MLAVCLLLASCKTAKDYRDQADEVAGDIINAKQREALGRTEDFTIQSPELTLRRRLIDAQALPVSSPAALGVNALEPTEHWPGSESGEDGYLDRGRGETGIELEHPVEPGTLMVSLEDALRIAARNSRNYQSEKETVFSTALALDLQRDDFRTTLGAGVDNAFTFDGDNKDASSAMATQTELSFNRRLKNGMSVTGALGYDIARLFNDAGPTSRALSFDTSVTIPLLRGAGEHIVTEPLQQAERDTVYAIWRFERFKRTFAVSIASDYLGVLRTLDNLNNQRDNYRRLVIAARRARNLAALGRLPEIQVDQAVQDELRARQSWISAQQSYARSLDQFKDRLGLPTDAKIELDRGELERLGDSARDVLDKMEPGLQAELDEMARNVAAAAQAATDAYSADALEREVGTMERAEVKRRLEDLLRARGDEPAQRERGTLGAAADEPVDLEPPDIENRGPMELDEDVAVGLAFQSRLDLRVTRGQVYDAQRQIVVAADGFLPEMTLGGSFSAGGSRGTGSYDADDDYDLAPSRGTTGAFLNIDLPLERTAERNEYRNALIRLERRVRDLQQLEDDIKFNIRDNLRSLLQARESLRIQARSLLLAQRRVDSTNLFLELGRTEIRDVLDAQEALVNAQNALTSALVTYRITELELQRDMGVLSVNAQGLWEEFDPASVALQSDADAPGPPVPPRTPQTTDNNAPSDIEPRKTDEISANNPTRDPDTRRSAPRAAPEFEPAT